MTDRLAGDDANAKHRPVPSHASAGLPKFACNECGDWWPCDNASDWTIDNPDEAEALREDEDQ